MMKSLIYFLLLLLPFLSVSCKSDCNNNSDKQNNNTMTTTKFINATDEQLNGIKKALDLYTEAAIKGDSKIAEPAFAETATMSYSEGDSLVSVPIQVLFDYYNNDCPQKASYEISACNVEEDAAIVSIDSDFGGTKFADMFTMVKDGNDWKIVSKIYHIK